MFPGDQGEQALAEMRQFFPRTETLATKIDGERMRNVDVCFYYRWCACLPVRDETRENPPLKGMLLVG